jgi:hypothetical protein
MRENLKCMGARWGWREEGMTTRTNAEDYTCMLHKKPVYQGWAYANQKEKKKCVDMFCVRKDI